MPHLSLPPCQLSARAEDPISLLSSWALVPPQDFSSKPGQSPSDQQQMQASRCLQLVGALTRAGCFSPNIISSAKSRTSPVFMLTRHFHRRRKEKTCEGKPCQRHWIRALSPFPRRLAEGSRRALLRPVTSSGSFPHCRAQSWLTGCLDFSLFWKK